MLQWTAAQDNNGWERDDHLRERPDAPGVLPPAHTKFIRSADDRFTYSFDEDGTSVTIADFHGTSAETELDVPETLDGHPVTCIDWARPAPDARPRSFRPRIIRLPETVLAIGRSAFEGFQHLMRVDLPGEMLYSIGDRAFAGSSIEQISLPLSECSEFGEEAFKSCPFLYKVAVRGDSFRSISRAAFMECHALRSVTLPASGETIEESAFANCLSLEHITLPQELHSLKSRAFANCFSLKTLTLPRKMHAIGPHVLSGCRNLTHVYLPKEIHSIHPDAFSFADTPNAAFFVSAGYPADIYCGEHSLLHLHI